MRKNLQSGKVKICFLITLLALACIFPEGHISARTVLEGLHYKTKKPVSVVVDGGRIISVKNLKKLSDPANTCFIAPGLIDNQVNGFAGVSFGLAGSDLTPEGILKVTEGLWKHGVTTYLPTLTTNSREVILKNMSLLAAAMGDPAQRGSIPGIHLEGPYISPAVGFRGAHPVQHVRPPDREEMKAFRKASGEKILTVTIAPETDGAMQLIKECTTAGIVVALGHHNGTKVQVDQAVENGARVSTHLGNGCANMINRHDNPLWPQLANEALTTTLICDGFHLRDEEIVVFYKVKGTSKTILTSDITHFAGLAPGQYKNEDGETIELTPEGKLVFAAQGVLYGSASPLSMGVVHAMKVTGCSLGDAFRMASANPAQLYGLNDRGAMEPGKRADLILFTIGDRDLKIRETWVEGKMVYRAE